LRAFVCSILLFFSFGIPNPYGLARNGGRLKLQIRPVLQRSLWFVEAQAAALLLMDGGAGAWGKADSLPVMQAYSSTLELLLARFFGQGPRPRFKNNDLNNYLLIFNTEKSTIQKSLHKNSLLKAFLALECVVLALTETLARALDIK
jgi:hypothetical protein